MQALTSKPRAAAAVLALAAALGAWASPRQAPVDSMRTAVLASLPDDPLPALEPEPPAQPVVTLEAAPANSPLAEPLAPVAVTMTGTPILGRSEHSAEHMWRFVHAKNPNFTLDVAQAFYDVGERYGIRSDIVICQAVLETGWFRFLDGTEVKPEQFNFGGLGVTALGETGCAYASMEAGVTALFQHLYAYATTAPLPEAETLVDTRFSLVTRGSAPCWEQLSGRWAMNANYGSDILRIYSQLQRLK